jgi:hypothetical protein
MGERRAARRGGAVCPARLVNTHGGERPWSEVTAATVAASLAMTTNLCAYYFQMPAGGRDHRFGCSGSDVTRCPIGALGLSRWMANIRKECGSARRSLRACAFAGSGARFGSPHRVPPEGARRAAIRQADGADRRPVRAAGTLAGHRRAGSAHGARWFADIAQMRWAEPPRQIVFRHYRRGVRTVQASTQEGDVGGLCLRGSPPIWRIPPHLRNPHAARPRRSTTHEVRRLHGAQWRPARCGADGQSPLRCRCGALGNKACSLCARRRARPKSGERSRASLLSGGRLPRS